MYWRMGRCSQQQFNQHLAVLIALVFIIRSVWVHITMQRKQILGPVRTLHIELQVELLLMDLLTIFEIQSTSVQGWMTKSD